ncbi:MAG: flagellar motor protein MotB [Rhodospirillaceae bacterium]
MVQRSHVSAAVQRLRQETAPQHEDIERSDRAAHAASHNWMVTFTDLVSLMLTFFVLLFSMSNVKLSEWEHIIDSLSRSLAPTPEKTVTAQTAAFNIGTIFRKSAVNLDYLASVIREGIAGVEILAGAQVIRLEDRMVIALPGDLLFETGLAVMTERAREAMFVIGGMLRNVGNEIGVDGHTDPTPLAGGAYASNWELLTGRAAAVANPLRAAGYPDDIIAFGYADSRYRQLPDVSTERRNALARRVDIVVMPTAGGLSR